MLNIYMMNTIGKDLKEMEAAADPQDVSKIQRIRTAFLNVANAIDQVVNDFDSTTPFHTRKNLCEIRNGVQFTFKPFKEYDVQPINCDNRRPGDPENGFLIYHRRHEKFGWTGRKVCKTQEDADKFINALKAQENK
ncbi:hypothetical protein [Desulfovibrio ferrophilus]|uniref:Uncharacterized protein n=1 Tax=Desulfovibrio ferrophilus TaxID=241368 RepID=A0A2Z6B3Z6_9BACT|nr:hypothetical protein [Desulfovibrio ferrophilus]BBD10136.1 uncharacterized protein DFE_A0035 [Desulfovibrio ferrophilus]